jgi:hypothetical protein
MLCLQTREGNFQIHWNGSTSRFPDDVIFHEQFPATTLRKHSTTGCMQMIERLRLAVRLCTSIRYELGSMLGRVASYSDDRNLSRFFFILFNLVTEYYTHMWTVIDAMNYIYLTYKYHIQHWHLWKLHSRNSITKNLSVSLFTLMDYTIKEMAALFTEYLQNLVRIQSLKFQRK